MRLSKITFAVCTLLSLSTSAFAQTATKVDWNGAFAGFHEALANGSYLSKTTSTTIDHKPDHKPSGFFAGVHAGLNHQRGRVVLGVVGDISHTAIDGVDSVTAIDPTFKVSVKSTSSSRIKNLSTLRARLGMAAGGSRMFYATAGLGVAAVKNDLTVSVNGGQYVDSSTADTRHLGWCAGGGFEAKVRPDVSLNLQYLYANFGSDVSSVKIFGAPYSLDAVLKLHKLQLGLTLHF